MSETAPTDIVIDDLAAFIQASPSSFHAAAEAARRLDAAGFRRLEEGDDWPGAGPGRPDASSDATAGHYVVRDGAVVAWTTPASAGPGSGFRIIGAHTDSPAFKLKPAPTTRTEGWLQAGVEVYGGPLLNSWLDRDLEFAGRIVAADGREHLVRTGPLARIPQLAIHLDRTVNDQGLVLDRQRHLTPVIGTEPAASKGAVPGHDAPGRGALGLDAPGPDALGPDALGHDALLDELARRAGVAPSAIAGFDVVTCDTQAPGRLGLSGELFAASRMDNLVSVHAGLAAVIAAAHGDRPTSSDAPICVLAAFDHEEVGSASRSGASGPFLDDVLTRVSAGLGADAATRRRALARSVCLSADAGHAVHPNRPERHDPVNRPRPGSGPLLKLNAAQRYASDAVGAGIWREACARAGVPWQPFVSNNAVPCGSTIGPLTATRLGIRTIDVGVPLLSMHSARELVHVDDVAALGAAATAFLS